MPSLPEVQAALARAVIGGADETATAAVVEDAPGAAARLRIYSNHYRVSLIDALAATFPVVAKLVGPDFFRFAARRFAIAHPPSEPCLFAYGAEFAGFLAALPEAASLVYLADVARLEWALNEAYFAADAPILAAERLQGMAADGLTRCRFPLHPSCRLLASAYPIDRIWRSNQDDGRGEETVSLDDGGVWLLVRRLDDDVGWLALDPPAFAFAAALAEGRSLAEAAGIAIDAGGFDLAATFALLVDQGTLQEPMPAG